MSLKQWVGVELDEVGVGEKVISMAGGLLGILLVVTVNERLLGLTGSPMLIASMGASAVLLFAAPHGQLSQPWPVVAGQAVSAAIGVTCAKLIPHTAVAAAVAVGLAIGAMHQLKCLHPPGGATALTAVVGGVRDLGYEFLWCPVLLNGLVIVAAAVVFNYGFRWRRYPACLTRRAVPAGAGISHEDVVRAIRSLNSFVDISEDDLVSLVQMLAANPSSGRPSAPG